jgi:hypothetical protein
MAERAETLNPAKLECYLIMGVVDGNGRFPTIK